MAITQQQVVNTLKLSGVFSLINGAASITDLSSWSALGCTSSAILLQIYDPTGDLVYQNTGYQSANYSSPDLNILAVSPITVFNFTLPEDINSTFLQGSYTINCSIQLISGFGTQTFSVTVYENVASCCNGIVANGTVNINYLNAQVSVTDNTQYGNYLSVANTLYIYPDPTTGQAAQHQTFSGTPATLIWQPPSGQKTYTGNWKWTLSSVLTYIDQTTQAETTCLVTGSGVFEVNENPVCKVLCYLNNYVTQVRMATAGSLVNAGLMKQQLIQAQGYFAMLLGQNECGNNADYIIAQIYALIGVTNPDDGCCGCGNTNVTPLIPTQSINGSNGTNGLSFLNGIGVPAGSLGVIGDTYLNSSTGDIYEKTGATTWTFQFNIIGATGATGAAGTNGSSIIGNISDGNSSSGTGVQTLGSITTTTANAAKNYTTLGDTVTGILRFDLAPGTGRAALVWLAITYTDLSNVAHTVNITPGIALSDASSNIMGRFAFNVYWNAAGSSQTLEYETVVTLGSTPPITFQGEVFPAIGDLINVDFTQTVTFAAVCNPTTGVVELTRLWGQMNKI